MSELHLPSSFDSWLENFTEEEDEENSEDADWKRWQKTLKSYHNTQLAYAYDTAPKNCDPYNYTVVDSDDEETRNNVLEWKECMSIEHEFYENECPYCPQGNYIGLKCPRCGLWHVALELELLDKDKKNYFQEKRAIELSRQQKNGEKSKRYTSKDLINK